MIDFLSDQDEIDQDLQYIQDEDNISDQNNVNQESNYEIDTIIESYS